MQMAGLTTYQFVHGTADHVLGHDDGTGDREDGAMVGLSLRALSGGGHNANSRRVNR